MRGLTAGLLIGLAGCQLVFDATPPPDGPPEVPLACRHPGLRLCLAFEDDLSDGAEDQVGDLDAELSSDVRGVEREEGELAIEVGMGSNIHLTDADAFDDLTAVISYDVWAKWSPTDVTQIIADNSSQFTISIRGLAEINGGLFIDCLTVSENNPGGDGFQSGIAAYDDNDEWHHIACVSNGLLTEAWVDGQKGTDREAVAPFFVDAGFDLYLGRAGDDSVASGARHFTGQIDNFRIWNRVLVPDEIDRFRARNETGMD